MRHLVESAAGRFGLDDVLLGMQSDTEAYFGRLKRARELMTRAQQLAHTNGENETASGYLLSAALREVEAGNPNQARRDLRQGLRMSSGRSVRTLSAMALARMGDVGRAESIADDLEKQFPSDTMINNFWLPTIRAAVALNRGDAPRALELSEATSAYELAPNTYLLGPYLRGQAYLETRKGNAAGVEFQKIIDNPGVVDNFILGALAHLGLGRAYTMQGDTDKAKVAYQDFLTLWKDADPDIPILKQAKVESAKLQ
jgi:eukaryotic-like serine/threonine-protein kinase